MVASTDTAIDRMIVLTADDILRADDLPMEFVPTPEWHPQRDPKAGVYVRTMTGREKDMFEREMVMVRDNKPEFDADAAMDNFKARLAAKCICDGDGQPVFQPHQVKVLGGKSALVLERIVTKIQQMNGMTKEDIEDIVGNSETTPKGGSITD